MEKRVVITGLGAVTPVGIGKDAFYEALLAGKSGIGPITHLMLLNMLPALPVKLRILILRSMV